MIAAHTQLEINAGWVPHLKKQVALAVGAEGPRRAAARREGLGLAVAAAQGAAALVARARLQESGAL